MATTLLPPPPDAEIEILPSDNGVTGKGPPREPEDESPRDKPEGEPERLSTLLGSYRLIASWIIAWIVIFFLALTAVVKDRWVGSDDWVSVPLPHVLYFNTCILLASSVAVELARSAMRSGATKLCIRWLGVTWVLAFAFLGGQVAAWRELISKRLFLSSNPGSLFVYLISGAHGLHLLGGIVALSFVCLFFRRWKERAKQQTAVDIIAHYWHFMDGLWIYLLVLLIITIQR
jgi:cytochrome c oxidase subunit III